MQLDLRDIVEGDAIDRHSSQLDQLAARAGTGDRAALSEFIEKIRPSVTQYVRARFGPGSLGPTSADDVVQEAILAILSALPMFTTANMGVPVRAWAYGIARNKVADAFRDFGRARADSTGLSVPDRADINPPPDQVVESTFTLAQLMSHLERLPQMQRTIITERIVNGRSAEDVARIIGSTSGAVRVAQHRALVNLRAIYSQNPVDSLFPQENQRPPATNASEVVDLFDVEADDELLSAASSSEVATAILPQPRPAGSPSVARGDPSSQAIDDQRAEPTNAVRPTQRSRNRFIAKLKVALLGHRDTSHPEWPDNITDGYLGELADLTQELRGADTLRALEIRPPWTGRHSG